VPRLALRHGRRAGNAEAASAIEAIAPYGAPGWTVPIKDVYVEREWVSYYGGVMAYRRDNSDDSALAQLSRITPTRRSTTYGMAISRDPYLLPEVVALDLTTIYKLPVWRSFLRVR
jgi:proline iminopeptidase